MRIRKRNAIALAVAFAVVTGGMTATASVAQGADGRRVSPSAPPAATPQGPFTVDMTNREDVRQFFFRAHESANGVDSGWNGSVDSCTPGTLSAAFLSTTATRENYFRAMAGVPSAVTFDPTYNAPAQAAALIVRAQQDLSHDPPSNWACWTQTGHDGAAGSNLGLSQIGPDGIDQWMYDGGGLNTATGHRRNMLYVGTNVQGYGAVPGIPDFNNFKLGADALYVNTPSVNPTPTPRDGFWAWPPKGFVPYQVVYPRWSFNLAGADFTNATVTMTHDGNNVPLTVQDRSGPYGDPAIVWNINGVNDGTSWPKPAADDAYTVTVSNVTVQGNTVGPFTYTTTIIDPSKGDAAHTPSGTASPPVGQNSTYTVPALSSTSAYQWRTTPLSSYTLNDGAENGLGNWTSSLNGSSYNPIQTTDVADGTHAFQLAQSDFYNPDTLTLNQTLVPNANSTLSFDSKFVNFDSMQGTVQVSTDGGSTWSNVYDHENSNDSGFSHVSVFLNGFAGQPIQLRFAVGYFGPNGVCECLSSAWHFDNVSLSSIQHEDTPTLTSVANPSLSFNPPSAGNYIIDVRPQYSNPTMSGVFSSPLQVAATGGSCVGCPGAPTISFVNKGSGWAVVGFSPPSNTGTSAITSYTVTTSPGNQTATVPGAARRAVLAVPNGTAQTATVTATNSSGTGPASSSSASFTPANASVNVTTNYNASDNNRLGKNASYYGQTNIQAQKTSVGIIAYLVGLVGQNPMTPQTPPAISGANAYTTAYSTSEQSVLVAVMKKYGLSPTEAQYFSVMLVGYLLSLGGH